MTTSQGVADRAIALTFDTVTAAQHGASNLALTISDAYRLTPLKFWGFLGAAAIGVAAMMAIARR